MPSPARIGAAGLIALPGGLIVYLGFNQGGYFPDAYAGVSLLLIALLILRVTLAPRPFSGISGPVLVLAGALALFALWTLASASWSESGGRAMVEFERALTYLLAVLLFGSLPHSATRLSWMLRAVAVGLIVVCGAALLSRCAADLVPVAANVSSDRLSWPITYWNALGLLAALAALLLLHLTADEGEPLVVRAVAAAGLPMVTVTLLFTFSRGAIAAGLIGLVAYVLLARPRGLPAALLATVVPVAVALRSAYDADLVQTQRFASERAVEQGHDVLLVVALCMAVAAGLRVVGAPLDRRVAAIRLPRVPGAARAGAAAVLVVVIAGAVLGAGGPAYASRQYDKFVEGRQIKDEADIRARLTNPANNGRIDHWRVALDGYHADHLKGSGAGTFQELWARNRPYRFSVVDGHSLYVEVLGELGLVGLAAIALAVLSLVTMLLRRVMRTGRQRSGYVAVLALVLTWAIHAGVDWDWEMPVVTLWVLAVGAFAIGARRGRRPLAVDLPRGARVAIAVGLLAVAVTPWHTFRSQRAIDRGVSAFLSGDCATTIDASLDSISALPTRSEPWELLGYCDLRLGRPRLAVRALDEAVARDPGFWEVHYGQALVRGAAGLDPRRAARRALALNPLDPRTRDAVQAFSARNRSDWQRRARAAPLPVPQRMKR